MFRKVPFPRKTMTIKMACSSTDQIPIKNPIKKSVPFSPVYCEVFTAIILMIVEGAILFCVEEVVSDDERLEVGLGSGGARTVC
jgi:hypothetical protein